MSHFHSWAKSMHSVSTCWPRTVEMRVPCVGHTGVAGRSLEAWEKCYGCMPLALWGAVQPPHLENSVVKCKAWYRTRVISTKSLGDATQRTLIHRPLTSEPLRQPANHYSERKCVSKPNITFGSAEGEPIARNSTLFILEMSEADYDYRKRLCLARRVSGETRYALKQAAGAGADHLVWAMAQLPALG